MPLYRQLTDDIKDLPLDQHTQLLNHLKKLKEFVQNTTKITSSNLISFLKSNLSETKKAQINEKINQLMDHPETQIADGFNYIFHVSDEKHCFKVGYSSRPNQRIREWDGIKNGIYQVPEQRKFERLIHLYLSNYNLTRKDKNLSSNFTEFFVFPSVLIHKLIVHLIVKLVNPDLHPHLRIEKENLEEVSSLLDWTSEVINMFSDNTSSKTDNIIKKKPRIKSYHQGKENINTCSKSYLMSITQIGDILSDRIIENRPYSSLSEIRGLYMIGPKRYRYVSEKCYCESEESE